MVNDNFTLISVDNSRITVEKGGLLWKSLRRQEKLKSPEKEYMGSSLRYNPDMGQGAYYAQLSPKETNTVYRQHAQNSPQETIYTIA